MYAQRFWMLQKFCDIFSRRSDNGSVGQQMFFEQEQVRLAATVTSFYTRKPTQGRLLCLFVTIH